VPRSPMMLGSQYDQGLPAWRRYSSKRGTAINRLLKSCAMPPVRCPMASIFWIEATPPVRFQVSAELPFAQ
jgi:hypothetical protein